MKTLILKFLAWLVPLVIEILYDSLIVEAVKNAEQTLPGEKRGEAKSEAAIAELKRRAPELALEIGEQEIRKAIDKKVKKLF